MAVEENIHHALLVITGITFILVAIMAFQGYKNGSILENYESNRNLSPDVEVVCPDGSNVPSSAAFYEYSSATMSPKANQMAIDGFNSGCNKSNRKQWKSAYAQTAYPLSTGVSKDGMMPAPGYYAGNHNPGVGPPQIQAMALTHAVETNIPIKL